MVMLLLGSKISYLGIQWISFLQRVNNFVFHSVKHVRFCAKEGVFSGNFTALLDSKEICSWSSQNSCWDLWRPYSVGNNIDASKIMVLMLKIKNTLAHQKSLKMKNWRHYFMKTHLRHKLNLSSHSELIAQQFRNILKPRYVKWHPVTYKGFCIISGPAMKNGYIMITLTIKDHGVNLAIHQHQQQNQIFMVQSLCSAYGEISWVYFIISCSNQPKPSREIAINYNWCVWAEHWRKNSRYKQRHNKGILQYDNTRLHVAKQGKTYLEMLKWEVLLHQLYSPDIAPSNYHLFWLMVHGLAEHYFYSYEDNKKWLDSWLASKDVIFLTWNLNAVRK